MSDDIAVLQSDSVVVQSTVSDSVVSSTDGAVVAETAPDHVVVDSSSPDNIILDGGGSGAVFNISQGDHQGLWVLDNATWTGTEFHRINITKPAIAMNVRGATNIPFESNTTGLIFWRAMPDGNVKINDSYGAFGGWENMFLMTEYRDMVLGGLGIEIDGAGTFPYGRFVNNVLSGQPFFGIIHNFFADYSGVDDISKPAWRAGVSGDRFAISRSPAGDSTGASLVDLLVVNADGTIAMGSQSSDAASGLMSAPFVNGLSSGKLWPAVTANNGSVAGSQTFYSDFTVVGAASPVQSPVFTSTVRWSNVSFGDGVPRFNTATVRFRYYGLAMNLWFVSQVFSDFVMRVDGVPYNRGTPIVVPSPGGIWGNYYYYGVTFSRLAWHVIEFILPTGFYFAGVYTELTDVILPMPPQKPKIIVVGDSFCEGAGSTSLAATGYVQTLFRALGWDNFLVSGVGGTGILQTFGLSANYRARFATDVIPYNPDIVIIQGSLNDGNGPFTPSDMATEVAAIISALTTAFPSIKIFITAQPSAFGPTEMPNVWWTQRAAIKAAAISGGAHFVDLLERPLPDGYTPLTHVTTTALGIGGGSFSVSGVAPVKGGTYKFPDETRFLVVSVTGSASPWTIQVEPSGVQTAQTIGTTITQVGSCPWTGTGHVGAPANNGSCDTLVGPDSIHPTQAGHDMIGRIIAEDVAKVLGVALQF